MEPPDEIKMISGLHGVFAFPSTRFSNRVLSINQQDAAD